MNKKMYEAPHTDKSVVQLESGFMDASIFSPKDEHDEGVTIEGHSIGNSGNYFDGDDSSDFTHNQWD